MVLYLLKLGADASTERHGYLLLHMAVGTDCEPGDNLLLSSGANPKVRKEGSGATALMLAFDRGYQKYVGMLINAGANLDLQDDTKLLALMRAMAVSNYEIVSMSFSAGANPMLRDDSNQVAIDIAEGLGPSLSKSDRTTSQEP